jgi:hypothetical protein
VTKNGRRRDWAGGPKSLTKTVDVEDENDHSYCRAPNEIATQTGGVNRLEEPRRFNASISQPWGVFMVQYLGVFLRIVGVFLCLLGPAAAQNPAYGVVTQVYPHEQRLRMVQSGAGSVRLSLNWNEAEIADNYYSPTYVRDVLAFVDRATSDGLDIYLTIAYTPGWANGYRPNNVGPSDIGKWREFLRDVFWTLGDYRNITFGIWNEPDLAKFLLDTQDARVWGSLWDAAVAARKDVGKPHIRLGGPDVSGDTRRLSYMDRALWRFRLTASYHDVFTFHFYPDHPRGVLDLVSYFSRSLPGREMWVTEGGANQAQEWSQSKQLEDSILRPFQRRPASSPWTRLFVFQMTDELESYELLNQPITGWANRLALRTIRSYATGTSTGSAYHGVSLTSDSGQFLVAEGGGGGEVNIDRWEAGAWEKFSLTDWNRKDLRHGDVITLATSESGHTISQKSPWSAELTAHEFQFDNSGFFVYRALGPGVIRPGDAVYLQAINGYYLRAVGGGGSKISVDASQVGPHEVFRIWW